MTAKHVPNDADRNKVRIMVSMGMTRPDIARVMGISHVTLGKYYQEDLEAGDKIINSAIAANIARQALKNDFKAMPAAFFWAKTRMGWRDVSQLEHSGPNGAPLQLTIVNPLPPKDPNL